MRMFSGKMDTSIAAVRIQSDGDNVMPEPSEEFVSTAHVEELTRRALAYLEVGYSVHFAGPAGTGKTTLAFHVAAKLGRAVTLIHGDDEFAGSDLVGRDSGYRKSKLVDNFIHSVLRTEEEMQSFWVDNRLTSACEHGDTLIYDEFTRSRPEANNALLSILSERILNLPRLRQWGKGYMEVHPNFRAIFTSNPEEYAGVHKTQDALMDRMITIKVDHYDRETEIQITLAKSGVPRGEAEAIVDIIRGLRAVGVNNHRPTIRASIAIARVMHHLGAQARANDATFRWICLDVLNGDTVKVKRAGEAIMPTLVDEMIVKICAPSGLPGASAKPAKRGRQGSVVAMEGEGA